jgi:lantibiotic transport system permease protein
MRYYLRALSVEHLKLKRTLTIWMVLVAPFVVNLMYFLTLLDYGETHHEYDPEAWTRYMQSVLSMWSILMLPLLITLQSALLGNSEHANQQWKHLFALPLPRWSYFAAKWTLLFELILLSSVFNFGFAIVGGWGIHQVYPTMGLTLDAIPWLDLFITNSKIFLAAILMLSIHTFISLRWQNIIISIGSGMVAVVASLFVMRSDTWGLLYPWTLPFMTFAMDNPATTTLTQIMLISLVGGALFALFGMWELTRRETM